MLHALFGLYKKIRIASILVITLTLKKDACSLVKADQYDNIVEDYLQVPLPILCQVVKCYSKFISQVEPYQNLTPEVKHKLIKTHQRHWAMPVECW